MTSSGFNANPGWHWPEAAGARPSHQPSQEPSQMPGTFNERAHPTEESQSDTQPVPEKEGKAPADSHSGPGPKSRTHWPPRTCRICLEMIQPTFHPPSENVPGIFQQPATVTYDSPDAEAGRLLRPCRCKGSSKYVHEGCLQAWRHADPGYGKRNYWQCPTCGFRYRLERMQWGRWISSTATQIVLTISIFIVALFFMGFVADPIINLYVDPLSIISSNPISKVTTKLDPIFSDDDVPTWTEHFVKGLASLGLLGFVKVIFALSPWHWMNVRSSGIMRTSQTGNTGRDRLANVSWIVVVIGVSTFLWAVYKGVRAWSRRILEKAGERVMDVASDNNDDDEVD